MTDEQAKLNDLVNRVARSCVAVVDTVVTRGGFKGEELTTIGRTSRPSNPSGCTI